MSNENSKWYRWHNILIIVTCGMAAGLIVGVGIGFISLPDQPEPTITQHVLRDPLYWTYDNWRDPNSGGGLFVDNYSWQRRPGAWAVDKLIPVGCELRAVVDTLWWSENSSGAIYATDLDTIYYETITLYDTIWRKREVVWK